MPMEHTTVDSTELRAKATDIALRLQRETVGYSALPLPSILAFIMSMIQQLINCQKPDPANAASALKNYVNARYSSSRGYDRPLLRRAMKQARKAGKKQTPRMLLDKSQQEEAAIMLLDRARLGGATFAVVSQAVATAPPDIDDEDDEEDDE